MVDAPKNSHLRGVHSVAWYYYFLYHNLRLQTLLESSRRRCLIAHLDPIVPQSIVFGNLAVFRNTPVAEVSNSSPPWHPKIIPCHFLVISTTISFGSAKAVGTFYGKSYVSMTIEWIAGVAVFTLLSWLVSHIFV